MRAQTVSLKPNMISSFGKGLVYTLWYQCLIFDTTFAAEVLYKKLYKTLKTTFKVTYKNHNLNITFHWHYLIIVFFRFIHYFRSKNTPFPKCQPFIGLILLHNTYGMFR